MKGICKLFIVILFPLYSIAGATDTTVQGVLVEHIYSPSIFPDTWREGSVNASGEQITSFEWMRAQPVIIKALKKYSAGTLKNNLHAVLLKTMSFFGVGYGGTNSLNAVYVTDNGETAGYTDAYIEQTFHHEFSSILFRNYPALLDTIAWKKENSPGFDYNDPDNGVGAIRNNQSSQILNEELAVKGFLTQYAMSSLENDINTIAQNLFRPAPYFWQIVDHYQAVHKKTMLLIAFYHKLDVIFTEQYFRQFDKQ